MIAGALDIVAAFITSGLRGVSPIRVLQAIASGLFGAGSYKGGFTTAALGLALHFAIGFGATAVYFAMSRKLTFLVERAVVCGLVYGVAVYLFMNFIVLPLSAIAFKPAYSLSAVATGLTLHILCVGLPISLVVRWCSK